MTKKARMGLVLASLLMLASCASTNHAPVVDRLPSRSLDSSVSPDGYYTVKPGDTLYSIALDFGLDWKDLAKANGLSDPNKISIGQKLLVQGVGGNAPVASSTGNATAAPTDNASGVVVTPVVPPSVAKPIDAQPGASKPVPVPDQTAKSEPPAPANASYGFIWPSDGKIIQTYKPGVNKGVDLAVKVGDPVVASLGGKVVYSGNALRGYGNLIIIKHEGNLLTAYAHNKTLLVKEGDSVKKGQKIAEAGQSDTDKPMLHFEVRKQGKPVNPMDYLPAR